MTNRMSENRCNPNGDLAGTARAGVSTRAALLIHSIAVRLKQPTRLSLKIHAVNLALGLYREIRTIQSRTATTQGSRNQRPALRPLVDWNYLAAIPIEGNPGRDQFGIPTRRTHLRLDLLKTIRQGRSHSHHDPVPNAQIRRSSH